MSSKIDELKTKLDDIQSRVDSMCRDMCERRGLDYDKEFQQSEQNDGEENEKTVSDTTDSSSDENTPDNTSDDDSVEKETEEDSEDSKDSAEGNDDGSEDDDNGNEEKNESIGGVSLYERSKFIFESIHGKNEDYSDYCFDDYIRESILNYELSESKEDKAVLESAKRFFGGGMVVSESEYDPNRPTKEEIEKWYDSWVERGRWVNELDVSPNDNSKTAQIKKFIKKMVSGNGKFADSKKKSDDDAKTPLDGEENGIKKFGNEIHGGIEGYTNKILPKTVRSIARKVIDKIPYVNKVAKAYDAIGGLDSAALATLGGLGFGVPGLIVGGALGKGLQAIRGQNGKPFSSKGKNAKDDGDSTEENT